MTRAVLALLLAASLRGCVAYEFEHEFWVRVDGSGIGERDRAARAVGGHEGPEGRSDREATDGRGRRARALRGLRPARAAGDPHPSQGAARTCSSSADFPDVNRLAGTPAFPDLALSLRPEGEQPPPRRALGAAARPARSPARPARRPHGRALPPAQQGLLASQRLRRRRARQHRGLARDGHRGTGRPAPRSRRGDRSPQHPDVHRRPVRVRHRGRARPARRRALYWVVRAGRRSEV